MHSGERLSLRCLVSRILRETSSLDQHAHPFDTIEPLAALGLIGAGAAERDALVWWLAAGKRARIAVARAAVGVGGAGAAVA